MKVITEHKFISAAIAIAAVAVIAWLVMTAFESEAEREDQAASVRQTIYDRAVQCYVIEGAYPESLSYLESHYGLMVDHKKFLIVYSPYAENQPPEIRVIRRIMSE